MLHNALSLCSSYSSQDQGKHRETHVDRDIETESQKQRHGDTVRDRDRDRQTDRQTNRQTESETDAEKQREKQTETDRQGYNSVSQRSVTLLLLLFPRPRKTQRNTHRQRHKD